MRMVPILELPHVFLLIGLLPSRASSFLLGARWGYSGSAAGARPRIAYGVGRRGALLFAFRVHLQHVDVLAQLLCDLFGDEPASLHFADLLELD